MNRLHLIIRRPGSLLSKMLDVEISEMQYAQIVLLLSEPEKWAIAERPPMGFRHPADPRSEITSHRGVIRQIASRRLKTRKKGQPNAE